ncbi:MAG: hypothetical protein LBG64_02050 [Pseudomonadales bacterium]|jgi:hypothetical protein|nr:hypothetical protein [Pseudomonadales bacterium]
MKNKITSNLYKSIVAVTSFNLMSILMSSFTHASIGTLEPTPGLTGAGGFGTISGPGDTGGPIELVNIVLGILTIIAGIALLFNIILAGIKIITGAGKPGILAENSKRILFSIAGLALIFAAYIIVGLVSFILFGDTDFILNPTLRP